MNIWDLTPHQLDVLRTLASMVGGIGGLLAGIAAWRSWLASRWAKIAAHQTATTEWQGGKLVTKTVAQTGRETLNAFQDEIRAHGRRRDPHAITDEIRSQ